MSDGDAISEGSAAQAADEARYRLLEENSTDVVYVTTPEGVLLYLSPACRALTGFEPEELVGRSGFDLVHPDEVEQVARFLSELPGRDGRITSRPYRALRKDGSYIWIESTIRPIRDAAGAVTELQVSAREVTDRVTAERRLRESRAHARAGREHGGHR